MSDFINKIDVYILCGGLGKRLKGVSENKPKPMVEIGEQPFLNIVITYLANLGFKRFILGIGYKSDTFSKYYCNFRKRDLKIEFSKEKTPLGTGGAVKKAKDLIKSDSFLVLNGDSFCEFDPLDFLNFHNKKKAIVSILLKKVKNAADYGNIKLDKVGRIINFNEKDRSAKNCLINAGVYIFDKKAFTLMPRKRAFSLERDFFHSLPGKKCFGYTKSGFFIDIGTPERYFKAREIFRKRLIDGTI